MIVSASTRCFEDLSLEDACARLLDLEYSSVEITLNEDSTQVKPSEVAADLESAIARCHNPMRLNVTAYDINITAEGDEYYEQFTACVKLAKATKVVTVTVPSAELGTPFNEEVERLRRLVAIAAMEGVRVGMKSQIGRLTQDIDTVAVLCDNVQGLGLTLDPSHYIVGPHQGRAIDKIIKYVFHVHLRDTSPDQLQVRVGQGEIEYTKLVHQLEKVRYSRALSVDMPKSPEVDHMVEMRKIRLLLESAL
ncbi:sugar phosphate isomerase/epimerase family protein [Lignipirellula cremea]|uniref:Xylose isomerase-like TIM barrel n=1 Tax=Lignipirellula cremea TaxID=2528010 RepID=A0A518DUM1_9BACT|nr:sugar phosphate isomerase/epimerase [Lignipirellula cremea]QDU95537.1 Xylose isomerase-like TIM barrel [Lignipirellula cremea]